MIYYQETYMYIYIYSSYYYIFQQNNTSEKFILKIEKIWLKCNKIWLLYIILMFKILIVTR